MGLTKVVLLFSYFYFLDLKDSGFCFLVSTFIFRKCQKLCLLKLLPVPNLWTKPTPLVLFPASRCNIHHLSSLSPISALYQEAVPTKHFYSHNLGKRIIFEGSSQLGKSDAYREMPLKLSQPHQMGAKARFSDLAWVGCQPVCLGAADQPRASQQSNEGKPRRCCSTAWLPGPQGSGEHREKRRRSGGQGWENGLLHITTSDTAGKSFLMPPLFTPHWGFVHILLLLAVTHLFILQQIWTAFC